MSLNPPHLFEIRKSHWRRPPRCSLQTLTSGNVIVRQGRHYPRQVRYSGHQRYQSVGATKTPGSLENLPQQSRPHTYHQPRMPSLHPPHLRGGTLYIPPRLRHLLLNGVTTHAPLPLHQRNWGPRSKLLRHPHRQTPRPLAQRPSRPSIHHDDVGSAEKGKTCQPSNHRKLASGLRHVFPPPRQFLSKKSSEMGWKAKGGPNVEFLEGHLQPPPQKS